MKVKKQRSLVTSRGQAGQLLSGLGQALSAGQHVVVPLDEDFPVIVPDEVTVSYEVKLDEWGRGKLELELRWTADTLQVVGGTADADHAVEPRHRGWLQPALQRTNDEAERPLS